MSNIHKHMVVRNQTRQFTTHIVNKKKSKCNVEKQKEERKKRPPPPGSRCILFKPRRKRIQQ